MGDAFTRKLYATYLSYLPTDGFSYPLDMHCDARGSFTEFLRTPERGQVSVNISRPGVVKGNHWHHTKNEKFLVVKGEGVIRFRRLNTEAVYEYRVSGDKLEVVDIPTGYTHSIENVGESDMVTVMWASEPFDPERPDTYFLPRREHGKDQTHDHRRHKAGDHPPFRRSSKNATGISISFWSTRARITTIRSTRFSSRIWNCARRIFT